MKRSLLWSIPLALAVALAGCSKEKSDAPEKPEASRPAPDTPAPDTPAPDTPAPDEPEPDTADEPPATAACETLDRAECLDSLHCTMHWIKNSTYECRPSKGACEENLKQVSKSACESNDGCAWTPGKCYCKFPGYGQTQVADKQPRGGSACACGGGPPPMCKAGS